MSGVSAERFSTGSFSATSNETQAPQSRQFGVPRWTNPTVLQSCGKITSAPADALTELLDRFEVTSPLARTAARLARTAAESEGR